MTLSEQKPSLDFFEDPGLDPITTATGTHRETVKQAVKKKAGFYLPEALIARFNHRFHTMKLDGVAIENKSALVEIALSFALDDLDKGEKSQIGATLNKV